MEPLTSQPKSTKVAFGVIRIALITGFLTALISPASAADRATSPIGPSQAFLQYWKSGLAELSSYEITTERYGEMRKAQGVLVFVYEELNADTRIKVESDRTPPSKRVPVLKLNNILKFNTGIYDYSIMTSVFAGLSGPGVKRSFQPQKVSFSSQEWCGNVYHHLLPMPTGLVSEIHSYFEAEGDSKSTLPYPREDVFYEDEMPILMRELDGNFLEPGATRKIQLVPSLWERRKRHVPLAFVQAVLTKAGPHDLNIRGVSWKAVKWTLEYQKSVSTFYVEAALPKKLLVWENDRGEKGELIASIRKTYWERKGNKDQPLRKDLGLSFGIGDGSR
ncbi:MAG: hypothetical protein M3Y08_17600 [Fibrobacterota bacterium]|nr:hypothetical protein [Fibrobacterota bacterium]